MNISLTYVYIYMKANFPWLLLPVACFGMCPAWIREGCRTKRYFC